MLVLSPLSGANCYALHLRVCAFRTRFLLVTFDLQKATRVSYSIVTENSEDLFNCGRQTFLLRQRSHLGGG